MQDEGKLSNKDHRHMDEFLTFVLEEHKSGNIETSEAVGHLAHVIAAIDKQNIGEARNWLENHKRLMKAA
jgi:hypothetical protein